MAESAPPVPYAFHADWFVLGEPGRALVRAPHRPDDPTWSPQERAPTRSRHHSVDRGVEPEPAAVHLDQECRGDPRVPRPILSANLRRRTLDTWLVRVRTCGLRHTR